MAQEPWYEFRERGTGDEAGQLLIPWQDGHAYEYAFDFSFPTPKAAYAFLQDMVDGESADWDEVSLWVLVRLTQDEIEPASAGLVRPGFLDGGE